MAVLAVVVVVAVVAVLAVVVVVAVVAVLAVVVVVAVVAVGQYWQQDIGGSREVVTATTLFLDVLSSSLVLCRS